MIPQYDVPQVAAVLTAAAHLIDQHGWATGGYRGPDGGYDITGAICAAAGNRAFLSMAAAEAVSAWLADYGENLSVTRWNDERCPSARKAADALRRTAARLVDREAVANATRSRGPLTQKAVRLR